MGSQPEDGEGIPGGPWGCLEGDTPSQRAVEGTHPGARQRCKAGRVSHAEKRPSEGLIRDQ